MHFVTQCTCVFLMILKLNSDYCPEQHSMAYLYTRHGEAVKQGLKVLQAYVTWMGVGFGVFQEVRF